MHRCVRQAHEGIEQLKMNLKKEHDLKVDWMTAVYCNVNSCHLRCLKHTVQMSHYKWLCAYSSIALTGTSA